MIKIYNLEKFEEFLELDNILLTWLVESNNLFKILFIENNIINPLKINGETGIPNDIFEIQTEPIITEQFYHKKGKVVQEINTLLHLCQIANGSHNKVIIILIIFDIIFKNFIIITEHEKFKITAINKINYFIQNNTEQINLILDKYNLDKDVLSKWNTELLKQV